MPNWLCKKCSHEFLAVERPEKCPKCGSIEVEVRLLGHIVTEPKIEEMLKGLKKK
ncbi:MAG: hypothetical protein QXQ02_02945 [Halobacteria archaeon]